jgi:imidazolonepropionase-like amidohydrolase
MRANRVSVLAILLVVGLSACGSNSGPSKGPRRMLVTASVLFDGTTFIEGGAILVEGSEIVEVGSAEELRSRASEVIDLGTSTLLPGVIDLHVHTGVIGSYPELVSEGITTVRDLGIPESVLPFPDSGDLRVIAAGPIITAPGGYPIPVHGKAIAAVMEGADEASEKVRELVSKGAGVIKIAVTDGGGRWPSLSRQEVAAIVDEAHEHDLSVTAHVVDRRGAEIALAGGVDEFAHLPCVNRLPRSLWSEIAKAEVPIVGTMRAMSRFCDGVVAAAREFVRAGGNLLYGSDLGNPGIPFGIDVNELRLMMRAGLSLEEVLASATSLAGERLGLEPLGSISVGATADVIAVSGDLRDDLQLLEDPVFVMAGGKAVVSSESS